MRLTDLRRLARDPDEGYQRVRHRLEASRDRRRPQPAGVRARALDDALDRVDAALGVDSRAVLDDPRLHAFEDRLREQVARQRDALEIPVLFNASVSLARLAYLAVRLRRPEVVVETGVAAGFSSSYLLFGLARNGAGRLHSIDLPLSGRQAAEVGWLVPAELRGRWDLQLGRSRQLLPPLLERAGRVDVFLHDSLHTYATMRWELAEVTSRLSAGAAVLMDDAEVNPAFAEWAARTSPATWDLVQTEHRGHVCGLAFL